MDDYSGSQPSRPSGEADQSNQSPSLLQQKTEKLPCTDTELGLPISESPEEEVETDVAACLQTSKFHIHLVLMLEPNTSPYPKAYPQVHGLPVSRKPQSKVQPRRFIVRKQPNPDPKVAHVTPRYANQTINFP